MKFKKVLLLTSLTLSTFAALMISGTSGASLKNSYEIIYYSDASLTQIVGHRSVTCSGARPPTGTVTSFSTIDNEQQCGSGGGFECPPSTGSGCFNSGTKALMPNRRP